MPACTSSTAQPGGITPTAGAHAHARAYAHAHAHAHALAHGHAHAYNRTNEQTHQEPTPPGAAYTGIVHAERGGIAEGSCASFSSVHFWEPGARGRIAMCMDVLVSRFLLTAGLLPENPKTRRASCVTLHASSMNVNESNNVKSCSTEDLSKCEQ